MDHSFFALFAVSFASFAVKAFERKGRRRILKFDEISPLTFRVLLPAAPSSRVTLLAGCGRGKNSLNEVAYVSAPQAFLRDQVAAVYNKTGTVKNGEAVQILARDRRFARVRTAAGAEGWLEQRYLVTKETYDAFQKLADQGRNDPVQATALAHNQSNIHLQPDRDAEHLYQVDQGAKLSLLKRASSAETRARRPGPEACRRKRSARYCAPDGRLVADSR